MRQILQVPVVRGLYARGLLFPVLVSVAVAGVLAHGAWTRHTPEEARTDVEPLHIPLSVPGLRADLDKTPLVYFSDFWRQLGERTRNKLLLLGPRGLPAVVVAPGVALTTLDAADEVAFGQRYLEARGDRPSLEVLGVDTSRNLGLVAVKQDDPDASFRLTDSPDVEAGGFLGAVSLAPDGRIRVASGSVVSVDPAGSGGLEVSAPLQAIGSVAALVDLDGALAGVVIPAGDGSLLLPLAEIRALVEELTQDAVCRAIEVADLSEELRRLLRVSAGALVEKVRQDSFLPEPSIVAGDVLLSWNGEEVSGADVFSALYSGVEAGALVPYTVLRGGRRVTGRTRQPRVDCRPVTASELELASLGLLLRWTEPDGWKVASVAEDSAAWLGGLVPDDLILSVNGRSLTADGRRTLERLDTSEAAAALTIKRSDRVKLLALHPPSS